MIFSPVLDLRMLQVVYELAEMMENVEWWVMHLYTVKLTSFKFV